MGEHFQQTDHLALREKLWIDTNPLFKVCILLSHLTAGKDEAYGAIVTQRVFDPHNGRHVEKIISCGWNMYAGGDTPLLRQGYASHGEGQSVYAALSYGYNLAEISMEPTVYVAGYIKSADGLLFINPPEISYTCIRCTHAILKSAGSAITIASPGQNGWKKTTIEEAHTSACSFSEQKSTLASSDSTARTTRHRADITNTTACIERFNMKPQSIAYVESLIKEVLAQNIAIGPEALAVITTIPELMRLGGETRRRFFESITSPYYHVVRAKQEPYTFWQKPTGGITEHNGETAVNSLYSRNEFSRQLATLNGKSPFPSK